MGKRLQAGSMEPGVAEPPLDYARVLLDAAAAPGLRKVERTRLRLLAGIARQIAGGTEAAALRVADVTQEAGLAQGTFYRYFADLPSAIETLVHDFAAFLHERLAGTRDGMTGSRARVHGATLIYARLFRANAGLMRCLIGVGGADTAFLRAFQQLNQSWNQRMAGAIARKRKKLFGAQRKRAASLLPRAYALGGMIDEFLTQLYLRRDPALASLRDDEAAVAELLTELWCLGAYGLLPTEKA